MRGVSIVAVARPVPNELESAMHAAALSGHALRIGTTATEVEMSMGDKAENTGDKLKGKAKEAAGSAVGNERLKTEGKADQAAADVKQAGEKVKDAAKDAFKR